jgi:hypothetical protein
VSKGEPIAKRKSTSSTPVFLKDLPVWFGLKNYEGTHHLDTFAWWVQISVRRTCFTYLRGEMHSGTYVPDWPRLIKEGLASLRRQPICDLSSSPFDGSPFLLGVSAVLPSCQAPAAPVRAMTLRDLYRTKKSTQWQVSPEQVQEIRKYESTTFRPFCFRGESWDTPLDPGSGIFSWSDFPLMIDLRCSNSALIDYFKLCLRMLRNDPRGKREEATRHPPDLPKWATQGLLPSMDLIIFAQEKGCKISNRILTDALGIFDEETVRKTIRPLAEDLLDPIHLQEALDRLRALARLDLTHRYIQSVKTGRKSSRG